MPVISLEVPADAAPGDFLSFVVEGNELEIPVPDDAQPGEILEIQIGGTEDEGQEEKSLLELPTSSERKILIQTSPEGNNVNSGGGCDGTFSMAWPAGLVLAEFLAAATPMIDIEPQSKVLELGSGLGVSGISFGVRFRRDIQELTLSDHSVALSMVETNVKLNSAVLPRTRAKALDWSTGTRISPNSLFDWIIGSDLLYNIEMIPSLVKTIEEHLSAGGELLFSIRWRKPELERSFFERLEHGSHKIVWNLLSGRSDTSWKKYGTQSDNFFRQSMVAINGQPKAIGQVTEKEMEAMSKTEYDTWERFQVQLYHGKASM